MSPYDKGDDKKSPNLPTPVRSNASVRGTKGCSSYDSIII